MPPRTWSASRLPEQDGALFFGVQPAGFFSEHTEKNMNKRVGCFTQEQLSRLAEQDNVSVYQPVHDITYEPWTAVRVANVVDRIAQLTRSGSTAARIRQDDAELDEFANKYTVIFQKLSDPAFVADTQNLVVVKKLIALRGMVEQGLIDENTAQGQSADIALKSLMARVES